MDKFLYVEIIEDFVKNNDSISIPGWVYSYEYSHNTFGITVDIPEYGIADDNMHWIEIMSNCIKDIDCSDRNRRNSESYERIIMNNYFWYRLFNKTNYLSLIYKLNSHNYYVYDNINKQITEDLVNNAGSVLNQRKKLFYNMYRTLIYTCILINLTELLFVLENDLPFFLERNFALLFIGHYINFRDINMLNVAISELRGVDFGINDIIDLTHSHLQYRDILIQCYDTLSEKNIHPNNIKHIMELFLADQKHAPWINV